MDEKDKKVADNQIFAAKERINNIDNQIDSNKEKIKNLASLEDGFVSLSKSVEKCVELLGASMKGNKIERKLADISDNNKIYLRNVVSSIDTQRDETNETIKQLYNARDEAEKEQKRLYREQEMEEHEFENETPGVERNTEIETEVTVIID
jgi:septal ring factor EnvC (AmiA/AmiB activator)